MPGSLPSCPSIKPRRYRGIRAPRITGGPSSLFAAGEQGAWYDPSDLTTLFQDSAGTVPVTTAGQPVGRMLDKSGRGNHATQATSAARPTYQTSGGLHWLEFDGIDDIMVTPTITPGVDKAQIFVGLQKLKNPAGIVVESSATIVSNLGSLVFLSGDNIGTNYSAAGHGSVVMSDTMSARWVGNLAPDTAWFTFTTDIAGNLNVIRRNGVNGTNAVTNLGTGNFLSYPLYIGSRATGDGLYFKGKIYGLTVRFGANLAAEQITSSEAYYAAKTGYIP